MNSKKKNKNRPKPPKIPQKLSPIESDKQESVENITTKIELESEKKEDFVAAPSVSNVEILKDEKIQIEETPKKPERGKGKKKPQCDKIQDDNIVESKLLVVDDKPNEQELLMDDAQEYLAVTSKTRKKKNKDKQQIDIQETSKIGVDIIEKLDSNEDIEIIQVARDSVANTPQADKIQESNTKIMKKKKKKRNRQDSEKSNVIESIESEKESLSQGKDIFSTVTLIDDCNIVESTQSKCDTDISLDKDVKETTIVQNFNPAEEEENFKNKKLNKKHKQLQQKSDDLITKNEIILLSEEGKQETDCLESCDLLSLGELTSKAQAAKSIDRKRKVKPGKQLTTSDKQDQSISSKTTTLGNVDSENQIADTKEHANIGQIIPPILDVEKQEEKLCTVLDKVLVDDNQSAESVDDFSDNTFREVKSTKKKKKQGQKNIELLKGHSDAEVTKTEMVSTLQLDQNIAEKSKQEHKNLSDENLLSSQLTEEFQNKAAADETEKSIVDIPDIIQYPRSTSQQLLGDSNNNTIIKEITPTDEIKLEIPICTSVPTVQGSGETPENKLQQEPLRVKLTEIDSKVDKCILEKTDIKSKMMEVNQDMEELRLSIERSLAELTALDKGDKEFEKKIQDKKLSVDDNRKFKQEVKESETTMAFLMPSFLVDKPATSVEDVESVKQKNLHICISPQKEITFPNVEDKVEEAKTTEYSVASTIPPVCPSRKDNKGKGKSKKKSKQESTSSTASCTSSQIKSDTKAEEHSSTKKETGKSDETQKETQNKGKQQSLAADTENNVLLTDSIPHTILASNLEPIEKFEDALTSSVDDVNQTFEMIASEATTFHQNFDNPQINIIAPTEDEGKEKNVKENPVTPPKNLLGHPDIPVPSNKTDYKKEKNKTPNSQQAKVKIKDPADIEKTEKISKQSQTYNKRNNLKNLNGSESFSYMTNGNNEFIYKYSFRKVYLQNFCIICKKELMQRYPCKFCSLMFYCSQKHMDEDWPQHQPLCFAVSTISHLKDQKHIYADAKSITGQDFRVLRTQMIVSCEKILKRKLVPWEQEALLYPRICADINCREWKQFKLKDCEGCEQISYCSDHADHLPVDHMRWCKSYALYQKLVNYQQTKGRLEPPMPTKILETPVIPGKLNEVLASMYEEKIDMNDIQYAALTQLATSPLTVAYSYQLFTSNVMVATNRLPKKTTFTVHVVGAELQFEADGLNKWEVFLLHLRPDIKDLRIVLIGPDLNPSNLPLDLLGKVTLCENCKTNRRRVIFSFHDKLTYHEYYTSDDFILPDIVCAFNPSIQRSSIYNGRDSWPSTIKCILKQKVPFVVTAYSLEELQRDLGRVKEFGEFNTVSEAKHNPFASVRPDRNFITDHEIPLLFKNYCLGIVCAI